MRLTGAAAKSGTTSMASCFATRSVSGGHSSHGRRVVVSRAKHFNGRNTIAAHGGRAQAATALKGCSFGLRTARKNKSSSSSPSSSSSSTRRVTRALVNVDFGPAMLLGSGMVASGLALYQMRVVRPEVSKDYDIMFASVALLCGGILIFQGWRLDPLLLFGQILTAGAAVTFAGEAIKLRGQVNEDLQAQIERERGGRNANTMNGGLPGQDQQTQDRGRQQQQQQDPYFQDNYDQRYYQDNSSSSSSSYYAYSGGTASGSRGASTAGGSYPSDMNSNSGRAKGPRRRMDLNSASGNGNFVEFQTQNNEPEDEDDGFYRYEDDESESYNQDDFNAYDVSSDWD